MGRTPLELGRAAKALAHWLADRPAAGRRDRLLLGLLLNLDAAATGGGGADAAGGNAGADLHRA